MNQKLNTFLVSTLIKCYRDHKIVLSLVNCGKSIIFVKTAHGEIFYHTVTFLTIHFAFVIKLIHDSEKSHIIRSYYSPTLSKG